MVGKNTGLFLSINLSYFAWSDMDYEVSVAVAVDRYEIQYFCNTNTDHPRYNTR
jgi:hypothetical protein